jgi:prepilin-type N-terminal cleavage/methylation domain-containing protein
MKRGRKSSRRGFTLVEVLATMLLVAIVIPAAMKGISIAARAGSLARHRNEAAGLAQSKLDELVTLGQWQGSALSGDFGPNWPTYQWHAVVIPYPYDTSGSNMQEVDLTVTGPGSNNTPLSVTLSTLVYVRTQSQQ